MFKLTHNHKSDR